MDSYSARFNGLGRLFSPEGLERLRRSHVCVIGLGGVGSWAVEALARSGIGQLTLIDMDDVCIGNTNRQLHALDGEFGKPKVEALARRVSAINPDCVIHPMQAFFLKSNAHQLLEPRFDFVLDAIDSPARKCLLIALCRERSLPIITTGASAGRIDPTAIKVTDLAFSSYDRLLQEVRKKLRTRHGFPRGETPFGVECVISKETVHLPGVPAGDGCTAGDSGEGNIGVAIDSSRSAHISEDDDEATVISKTSGPDLRLDCNTGFGTATFVTGVFGFVAASRIVQRIATGQPMPPKTI